MIDFEARGGRLVIEYVSASRASEISAAADLTVLAAGKGELAALIPRDDERSEFDRPQRRLIASIVAGVRGWGLRNGHLTRPVKFTFFGDAGEWFFVPFTHKTAGPAYALNFMVRPNTYLDRFAGAANCAAFLAVAKAAIAELAPEDTDAITGIRPVNDQFNYLPFAQGLTPTVRRSHALLPSGKIIIPLGDTGITYDPIGGQGYNSAARHAKWVADAVTKRGGANFDDDWATGVFDGVWDAHGRAACAWNNLLLKGVPAATAFALQFAADNPDFADIIFKDFFRPRELMSWIADLESVQHRIAAHDAMKRSVHLHSTGARI
jgi:hypothetical protein